MAVVSLDCSLPRPDIGELHDAISTELSKRLLGGAPVLPMSTEDVLAFIMAGTTNLMWGYISQSMKEQDPHYACCDNLVVLAGRRGIHLQGATRAKGYVVLTGTPHAPIPAQLRFVGASSRAYKLDIGVTFNPVTIAANGSAVLRIVSVLAGSSFNLSAGAVLTVGATLPGIDGTATVIGNGLTGGTNTEDCEALRRRVIAAEQTDVLVVNEAWYIREGLRYPGVTRVCTDECEGCCDPTYITLYPFMEGVYGDIGEAPYGIPPCEVLDEMNDWMFGREAGRGQGLGPIGIRGGFQQALPTPMNVAIRCAQRFPPDAVDRIRAALDEYLRYNFCVGSTICRDQVRAAIYRALGPDPCLGNIEFTFDEGVRFEDQANTYLDCGRMLVVGDVSVVEGYCAPICPPSSPTTTTLPVGPFGSAPIGTASRNVR